MYYKETWNILFKVLVLLLFIFFVNPSYIKFELFVVKLFERYSLLTPKECRVK